MLNVLLSHKLDVQVKQQRLATEFDMKMDVEEKGLVSAVCNLSEIIVEETTEKVTREVTNQLLVKNVRDVMDSLNVALERACEILKISLEIYYEAVENLKRNETT